MGKGGCVNGELDTASYGSPVPLIGLYIAAATLVCFFCITFDLVNGLFIRKKPFVPCKLFPMNAFTMTVLALATKLPVDLTASMPRAEDQLSKLTGTALLCISLGFYMPSLGTMGTSERYGNMAALSVMVITMVVNVCIQMRTGVIFAFIVEHIIIMFCILILLLLMWSSAIAFRGQSREWTTYYTNCGKGPQGLRKLLLKLHLLNYTGNPQTLLCETSHHHTFGLLCALSSAVVLQAMLRSFVLKNMRFCSGVSDYRWSIPIVIVVQFLTIVVGTFSIICRWVSFVSHSNQVALWAHKESYFPERELEFLKLNLSFRFLSKNLSNVFLVAKDFIMNVLIRTQIALYTCSSFLVGYPIYFVKAFLGKIVPFDRIFHEHTEDIDRMLEEMSTSMFSLSFDVFSSLQHNDTFIRWITNMALKDMIRWTNTYKRNCPTHFIQLITNCSASKSECALFIKKLEAIGNEVFAGAYDYRVSCVSVLVLSGMLAELMPTSRRESLMYSLDESFEIIYFVDQKTDTPSMIDEVRWRSIKDVWAQWENPNHWFRTIISQAFKKKFKGPEFEQHDARGVLRDALDAMEEYLRDCLRASNSRGEANSFAGTQLYWIGAEFFVISKFLRAQEYESDKDLFDFLEKCFVQMLCFTLFSLPLAILKEIGGDDPTRIGEGRVRKALKFFCKLEMLKDTIEWAWPAEFDPESQPNDDLSPAVVTDSPSEVEPKVSNLVDREIGNSDASFVIATADDDDDTIKEVGSNEIL
ncbi:uncharacterized protein LOC122647915 [Telopea speciosissima]|uniref:uncharacterized protein LOC122647915 n=1 Tax=Telopea speciosissima TaxID=54955 RepID=UPI001CC3D62B|nr:uncharacterized protein LOC122647915 [Telopea speciosissima]